MRNHNVYNHRYILLVSVSCTTRRQCSARLEPFEIKHNAPRDIGKNVGLAEDSVYDRGETHQNVPFLRGGGGCTGNDCFETEITDLGCDGWCIQ